MKLLTIVVAGAALLLAAAPASASVDTSLAASANAAMRELQSFERHPVRYGAAFFGSGSIGALPRVFALKRFVIRVVAEGDVVPSVHGDGPMGFPFTRVEAAGGTP